MIDFQALGVLFAIVVSIGTLYLSWRKAPHDNRNLDADSETKLSKAALELIEPLQKRIDELELVTDKYRSRIAEHERRIADLECELREERSLKAEIISGAERLMHQVESLGAKPVYVPPKRGTGELKAK